jgi:hypothetical protein
MFVISILMIEAAEHGHVPSAVNLLMMPVLIVFHATSNDESVSYDIKIAGSVPATAMTLYQQLSISNWFVIRPNTVLT